MKTKILLFLNTITFGLTLYFNYLSSVGVMSDKNVSEVSDKFNSLITPADYAFSIWGFIYLLVFGFVIYQWYSVYKLKDEKLVKDIGIWFIVTNMANAFWLMAWVNELVLMSVFIMSIMVYALVQLVFRLRLEIWDAPLKTMFFVWWPITFYFGWIVLASVVNFTAFIVSLNLNIGGGLAELLALIVLIVAAIIYYLLVSKRNLREAALVGVWGFVAIAVKQSDVNVTVTYTALILALLLLSVSGRHAYMNRETLPGKKIQRKEF